MTNKFDFFYSKMLSGPTRFSAVAGSDEFKGAQLLELLGYVIHWRDVIEISDKDMLVNDDKIASEIKQKLAAAGFTVEPLKMSAQPK